jgi:Cellulase (glycosyl hydrolase family 5)
MRRLFFIVLLMGSTLAARGADRIDFWDTPQHGANCFNETPPTAEYFHALRRYGATWVRLTFSKWKSARSGDFLFGNLDDYQALVPQDLATLRRVLDAAYAEGLGVVLTPLELPGARWIQQNNNKFDDRLWTDKRFWQQSANFWRDLAAALRDHPAIVAYNLINEPVPEKKGGLEEHSSLAKMETWYLATRGSARDLPALYELLGAAVRGVDTRTPVMLDAGFYAAADAWYWPAPSGDARTLYAYHMYEPWLATSSPNIKANYKYRYPGVTPFGGQDVKWDAARVAAYLHQPIDWAKAHRVPVNRMVAAEFGCVRTWPDCPRYLEDVLTALDADGVHWAFYSFREAWDAMDYELGPDKLPWQYWQAVEAGKPYELKRGPNKVFEPIQRRLARNNKPQAP